MIRFDSCGSSPLHIMAFSLQTPFLCVYLHTPLLMMTSASAVTRMVTWVNVLTSGRYWGSVGSEDLCVSGGYLLDTLYNVSWTLPTGGTTIPSPARRPGGCHHSAHCLLCFYFDTLMNIDMVQSPKLSRPLTLKLHISDDLGRQASQLV